MENATLEMLGSARQVKVTKDETTIVDGKGNAQEIKNRINQIKIQIEDTTSDYDREKLQERLAKLAGGVAVIQVGAATETEMNEKKHRIEDALSATRAAVEEGVVPGGGVALLQSAPVLDELKKKETGDVATGISLVRKALEEPRKQIAIMPKAKVRYCRKVSALPKGHVATRPTGTYRYGESRSSIRQSHRSAPSVQHRGDATNHRKLVTEIPEKENHADASGRRNGLLKK